MNDFNDTLEAVILTGNITGPDGRPQALQPVYGHPALARIAAKLLAAGIARVFISTNQPSQYVGFRGFYPIKENYPGYGPLAGIESALAIIASHLLLTIPADMPMITTDDITELINESVRKPAQVVHAVTLTDEVPLFAVINRGILPSVRLALEEDRLNVSDLYKNLDRRTVLFTDQSSFEILDSPGSSLSGTLSPN